MLINILIDFFFSQQTHMAGCWGAMPPDNPDLPFPEELP